FSGFGSKFSFMFCLDVKYRISHRLQPSSVFGAGPSGLPIIFPRPAIYFHLDDSKKSLPENAGTHFGLTLGTIGKDNWYFYHAKSVFDCREFHFDLKRISHEFDPIER